MQLSKGKNSELEIVIGTVIEALPNTQFRVEVPGKENLILAYLAGKMRMHKIRVLIGDRVEMVLDLYGEKGRITKRL
ncbi:MAG: translation initiation factor IF-1 [Patescibacteria group bacterium]|nr:translation initiation factor IF-1 [bacterium]MDZ4240551.1 translation initiation factor IF-1 [Patescibacteria group bacterium]